MEDSEGTETFTRMVNDLFDALNIKLPSRGVRHHSKEIQVTAEPLFISIGPCMSLSTNFVQHVNIVALIFSAPKRLPGNAQHDRAKCNQRESKAFCVTANNGVSTSDFAVHHRCHCIFAGSRCQLCPYGKVKSGPFGGKHAVLVFTWCILLTHSVKFKGMSFSATLWTGTVIWR